MIPFAGAGSLFLLFVSVGDVLFLTVVEMGGGTVSVNTGRAFFSGGVVIGEELKPKGTHALAGKHIQLQHSSTAYCA